MGKLGARPAWYGHRALVEALWPELSSAKEPTTMVNRYVLDAAGMPTMSDELLDHLDKGSAEYTTLWALHNSDARLAAFYIGYIALWRFLPPRSRGVPREAVERLGKLHGVSPATAYRWVKAAESFCAGMMALRTLSIVEADPRRAMALRSVA